MMNTYNTLSSNYQLVIEDLDVTVKESHILSNVNSVVKSGELLAIMGATGAGKSTLLNAVAGRIPVLSGSIALNGDISNEESRPLFGFVLQEDVFMSKLTLYETLYFTAMIKIPETVALHVKLARIYDIVDSLDLRKCLNTVIGDLAHKGISGGEKKRLSIACEILSDPNIMLVDEPTSGLDSNTALSIMRVLKRYATFNNRVVITTIHQPSSDIYDLFSNLLLLLDGKVIYSGRADVAPKYFEQIGIPSAVEPNPADFVLMLMKSDTAAQTNVLLEAEKRRYFSSEMEMTELNRLTCSESNLDRTMTNASTLSLIHTPSNDRPAAFSRNKWPTSFLTQFKMLTWRQFKQSRGRMMHKIDIISALCTALIVGLLYFQIEMSYKTLRDKMGAVFFCAASWIFRILPVTIINFHADRNVIWKERHGEAYRLSAYYFGKIVSELPLIMILPVIFYSIVYWMSTIGDAVLFSIFVPVNLLFCLVCQSIGQVIGSGITDLKLSAMIAQFYIACSILLSMMCFIILNGCQPLQYNRTCLSGGFYNHHAAYWFKLAKYVSIIHYPYACINILMTDTMPVLWCNTTSVELYPKCKNFTFITRNEVLRGYQIDSPYYVYIVTMAILLVTLTILGYFVFKWQKY